MTGGTTQVNEDQSTKSYYIGKACQTFNTSDTMVRYDEDGKCITFGFGDGRWDIVDMVDPLQRADLRDDDPVPQDEEDDDGAVVLSAKATTVGNHPTAAPKPEAAPVPDIVRDNVPGAEPLANELLIKAVLEGKTVQWRRPGDTQWDDLRNRAFAIRMLIGYSSVDDVEFRLKPENTVLWGVLAACEGPGEYTFFPAVGEADARSAAKIRRPNAKMLRIEIDEKLSVRACVSIEP